MSVSYEMESISVPKILAKIRKHLIRISIITSIICAISVVVLINLPNTYKSEAKLSPATDKTSAGFGGQLGGLASLAGINLSQLNGEDKTLLAIEILRTRNFIVKVLRDNDLVVPVMASKGWNKDTGDLVIDDEIYDLAKNKWVREPKEPYGIEPSDEEIYFEFKKEFSVYQDEMTGIVTVRFTSYSPKLSKKIVDLMISGINEDMRSRDIDESKRNIDYLEKKIQETTNSEIKKSFYLLIEEQMKKLMIANVSREYVLKIIEPSYEPIKKSGPKRALLLILIGLMSSLLVTVFYCVKK